MSDILNFIEAELACRRGGKTPKLGGWLGCSDFIKAHGQHFTPMPLPPEIEKGRKHQCYQDAAEYALFGGDELYYCEGLACGVIPVSHSWLCNERGEVIDRTWAALDQGIGTEYFGIAFNVEFLRKTILQTEKWGPLIDNWTTDWPLLRKTPPEHVWKVKIKTPALEAA